MVEEADATLVEAMHEEYYRDLNFAVPEAMRRVLALVRAHDAPGHTDMMVAPEGLDAFMAANPLPEEDAALIQRRRAFAEKPFYTLDAGAWVKPPPEARMALDAAGRLDAQAAEIAALRARVAGLEGALTQVDEWANAYPVSVFPEPDMKACAAALAAAGQSSDALHASWARHILSGVALIAARALSPAPKEPDHG